MASSWAWACRVGVIVSLYLSCFASSDEKSNTVEKEKWKKRDVRDYTDVDVEKLYEQWEVPI